MIGKGFNDVVLFLSSKYSQLGTYNTVIWSPHFHTDIEVIEKVHMKFLRSASYKMGRVGPIYNTGVMIHLSSLENSRIMLDLCFLVRFVNGFIDCPNLLDSMIQLNIDDRRNRNVELFKIPFHHTNKYQQVDLFHSSVHQIKCYFRNVI